MNNLKDETILSVETTVDGGSLALLRDGREIDSWIGSREVSKAEDILAQASQILENNKIDKKNIGVVVVSKEENSTGGKIGAAIAKGLVKSLKCRLIETPVLESLLLEFEKGAAGVYLSAVPVGKSQIKWQRFDKKDDFSYKPIADFRVTARSRFVEEIRTFSGAKIILANGLKDISGLDPSDSVKIPATRGGQNLAKLNALAAIKSLKNKDASDNESGTNESL